MRNNSGAMLATIALVGLMALLLGFFDQGSCVVPAAEGFISCAEIENQRVIAAWILGSIVIFGFTFSIIRRRKR